MFTRIMDYITADHEWRIAIDYHGGIRPDKRLQSYEVKVVWHPGQTDRLESIFYRNTLRDALSAVVVTMEYYQQNRGR